MSTKTTHCILITSMLLLLSSCRTNKGIDGVYWTIYKGRNDQFMPQMEIFPDSIVTFSNGIVGDPTFPHHTTYYNITKKGDDEYLLTPSIITYNNIPVIIETRPRKDSERLTISVAPQKPYFQWYLIYGDSVKVFDIDSITLSNNVRDLRFMGVFLNDSLMWSHDTIFTEVIRLNNTNGRVYANIDDRFFNSVFYMDNNDNIIFKRYHKEIILRYEYHRDTILLKRKRKPLFDWDKIMSCCGGISQQQ